MRERYFNAREIAEKLGKDPRYVRKMATDESWNYIEKKVRGGFEKRFCLSSLPTPIRVHLEPQTQALVVSNNTPLSELELEPYNRTIADARLKCLSLFDNFKAHNVHQSNKESLVNFSNSWESIASDELFSIIPKLSFTTLWRWEKCYADGGITALAPKYGWSKGATSLPGELKGLILSAYLDQNMRSARSIHSHIIHQYALGEIGLGHPIKLAQRKRELAKIVSLKKVRTFIDNNVTSGLELKARGVRQQQEKVSAYMTRDPSSLCANFIWVSDGHDTNTSVFDEWGKAVRPVIVVWMDQFSRKIMGHSIDISENTGLIVDSLLNGVEKYGRPECVYVDNGKAYINRVTSDKVKSENHLKVYRQLGCQQMNAKPYNAREKSVEAFWRRFDNDFSKWLIGYTGASIEKRPEEHKKAIKSGKILDMDSYKNYVENWILKYNSDPHTGMGMNGRSPEEVYMQDNPAPVLVSDELLTILRLKLVPDLRKVQAGGRVRYENREYIAATLLRHIGMTVELAIDKNNLDHAYIFLDGKLLTTAEAVIIGDFTNTVRTEKSRKQLAKVKAEEKKINKQLLEQKKQREKIVAIDTISVKAPIPMIASQKSANLANVFDY